MKRICSLFLSLCLVLGLCACGQKAEEVPEAPADVPAEAVPAWLEQFDLGVRYLSEGNYEEAIIAFTAVIDIDPKNAGALSGRGQAYVLSGETEANLAAALADFEAALAADETLAEAWLGLADVYIWQGDYDRALNVLKEALEKTGNDPVVAERIAKMEQGNFADSSGRKKHYRYYGADGLLTHSETVIFDAQGQKIADIRYDADGNEEMRFEYAHEYDENDRLVVFQIFHKDKNDADHAVLDQTQKYTYDENGNRIRMDIYGRDDQLDSYTTSEFDANGNKIKETVFDADGTMTSFKTIQYDENGEQTGDYYYDGAGNLERYHLKLYNDAGEYLGWESYDGQGNLTGTQIG